MFLPAPVPALALLSYSTIKHQIIFPGKKRILNDAFEKRSLKLPKQQ